MRFTAYDGKGEAIRERSYYSVGGGFVADETGAPPVRSGTGGGGYGGPGAALSVHHRRRTPRAHGQQRPAHLRLMLENEKALGRTADEIYAGLADIWQVMQACVERGCATDGMLPGGLKVQRRAPRMFRQLTCERDDDDPLRAMDWVTLYALAVNEENAAGGRVVTAPTNGAAGIIPAVMHYYVRFVPGSHDDGVVALPADRGRARRPVQGERVDFRRRGRLPGRGRVGLLDGGRRADRGAGRHAGADRKRRRDRHGAQPRA